MKSNLENVKYIALYELYLYNIIPVYILSILKQNTLYIFNIFTKIIQFVNQLHNIMYIKYLYILMR